MPEKFGLCSSEQHISQSKSQNSYLVAYHMICAGYFDGENYNRKYVHISFRFLKLTVYKDSTIRNVCWQFNRIHPRGAKLSEFFTLLPLKLWSQYLQNLHENSWSGVIYHCRVQLMRSLAPQVSCTRTYGDNDHHTFTSILRSTLS